MADAKISALNSLTSTTVDTADVLPIVDTSATETKKITYGELSNFVDSLFTIHDDSDTTKKIVFQLSGITTATTRTITAPDASGTLTLLGNSSTGSGSVVLATTPTLVTPVLGAATATSINGLTITSSTGTLTITDAKTLTVSNTLTLAGTDGKGINVGAATSGKILIGDGTNMVLSTSTIPTSAGATANKVLLSDGTNYVLSTPTFPNASATSGKFIRSDGTNWVASTPTLPTSAGSAGKILASDGTNYVESTPTFPYSASATSGKIIKSDGTNWTASTETYAAPSTSGNVMTSDGTNWTSATPATSSVTPQLTLASMFEDVSRFITTTASGGTINFGTGSGVSLDLTTTSGSRASMRTLMAGTNNSPYASNSYFSVLFDRSTNGTDYDVYFGVGLPTLAAGSITYTPSHYGFKIVRIASSTTVYATNSGGTETATDCSQTINNDTNYLFHAQKNGTTNIKYYIDRSLKATHTTNLPSATTEVDVFTFEGTNRSTATASTFYLGSFNYSQDAQ